MHDIYLRYCTPWHVQYRTSGVTVKRPGGVVFVLLRAARQRVAVAVLSAATGLPALQILSRVKVSVAPAARLPGERCSHQPDPVFLPTRLELDTVQCCSLLASDLLQVLPRWERREFRG